PPSVVLKEIPVGIGRLGVLVEVLHVRVRRRAVEVEVVFLDILAVVGLAVSQPKQALLQDRVLAVPQGHGKAKALLVVGDAGQAVLAPAISAGASLVVAEVVPGVPALAVVLAHRAPLALAEIWPPLFPRDGSLSRLFESDLFGSHE